MVLPMTGALLRTVWSIAVLQLQLPVATLLIGCLLEGASGGTATFTMAAFASISDVSSKRFLGLRIIILELCSSVGVALSLVTTGYVMESVGFSFSLLLCTGYTTLALIYTIFAVKETIIKQDGANFFTSAHLKRSFRLFTAEDGTGKRTILLLLISILALAFLADVGSLDSITLTMLGPPLCLTSVYIGFYMATMVLVRNIGGLLVARGLMVCKVHNAITLGIACLSGIGFFITFASANDMLILYMAPVIGLCGTLTVPMTRALGSRLVKDDEQGAFFSGVSFIQGASVIVGASGVNSLYAATVKFYHGITFLVLAGVYCIALMLTIIAYFKIKKRNNAIIAAENAASEVSA